MIPQIQSYIDSISNKQQIQAKDIISNLKSISQSIEDSKDSGSLISVKGGKLLKVDEIKRYDVVYVSMLAGVPHYFLVDKVVDDKVYCLCLTSTFKDYLVLHEVAGDRTFIGSYISNTYYCLSLEECKKSFVRTYEDKREALLVFNRVKRYYKDVFNL